MNTQTEDELKQGWWWRQPTHRYRFAFYEHSARQYELARRVEGSEHYGGKPWPELSREEQDALAAKWPDELASLHAVEIGAPGAIARSGFTDFRNASYNLRCSDKALVSCFEHWLRQQRKLKKVQPAKIAGGDVKPRSWRSVELLDVQQHGIRPLTASERSQVSKAVRSL